MNEKLAARAEIEKLSRLLGVSLRELHFLLPLPSAKLAELATVIAEVLFEDGRERFDRIDKISRAVPNKMAATIAQRHFGPLMTAMITATYPPQRAAANAAHMTPEFLAEVSMHLEPSKTRPILNALPDDVIVATARQLMIKREFITMGRFVGFVSDNAIERVIDSMTPIELLSTAMFIEADDALDDIISRMSDERIQRIIMTAATANLWIQALTVADGVGSRNRSRLADLAAVLDDHALEALAKAADGQGVLDVAISFVAKMSVSNRSRISAVPYLQQPGVMDRCYKAGARAGLLVDLMTIVSVAQEKVLDSMAAALAVQPTQDIVDGAAAADEAGAREVFDSIVERMGPDDRARVHKALRGLRSA